MVLRKSFVWCGGTGRIEYGSDPAAGVVPRNEGGAWVLCRTVATRVADFKTGWWL